MLHAIIAADGHSPLTGEKTPDLTVDKSGVRVYRPNTSGASPRSSDVNSLSRHTGRLLQYESMKPRTAPAKSKQPSSHLALASTVSESPQIGPETEANPNVADALNSERTAPSARMPNRPQYESAMLGNTFQSQVETYDPRFGKESLPLQYYHTQMVPQDSKKATETRNMKARQFRKRATEAQNT